MHGSRNRAQDTLCMINEPDNFPQIRLAAQIDNAAQSRMKMTKVADLHELDSVAEVVDDALKARPFPPLNRDIVLSSRHDNPKRNIGFGHLVDLGVPRFFDLRNVDVASKLCRSDLQAEPGVQEINISVQAMVRLIVTTINQWIGALNQFDVLLTFIKAHQIGIVLPDFGAKRPHVCLKLIRISSMQIADRGGHHYDVAGREKTSENEFSHSKPRPSPDASGVRATKSSESTCCSNSEPRLLGWRRTGRPGTWTRARAVRPNDVRFSDCRFRAVGWF